MCRDCIDVAMEAFQQSQSVPAACCTPCSYGARSSQKRRVCDTAQMAAIGTATQCDAAIVHALLAVSPAPQLQRLVLGSATGNGGPVSSSALVCICNLHACL